MMITTTKGGLIFQFHTGENMVTQISDIAQGRAHIYKDYHMRPLAQTSASF